MSRILLMQKTFPRGCSLVSIFTDSEKENWQYSLFLKYGSV